MQKKLLNSAAFLKNYLNLIVHSTTICGLTNHFIKLQAIVNDFWHIFLFFLSN